MMEGAIEHASRFDRTGWDDLQPFPLSDEECAALCRGHAVRWGGSIAEVGTLPGRYELIDGWLMLKR